MCIPKTQGHPEYYILRFSKLLADNAGHYHFHFTDGQTESCENLWDHRAIKGE